MRIVLVIIFSTVLFGCSTDEVVPCSGEGLNGQLCRAYRFYNEDGIGFTEYNYQGDTLVISEIYDTDSRLQKTVVQRLANNQTVAITEQFPAAESRVKTFHYNEIDSLFLVVYGANDSSLVINYENGKRKIEDMVIDSEVMARKEYRYFQDDGELYRISFYLGTDSLLSYQNYDYFTSNGMNQYRVSVYNPDFSLVGRRLFSFTQDGLIKTMEFRLADNQISATDNYIYDGSGMLQELQSQRNGATSKTVYVYH